jgi:hypothetical protein
MPLSPEQRSLRARLGAHTLHSRYDSRELTKPARAGFMDKLPHALTCGDERWMTSLRGRSGQAARV